jgi:preprotein translocase subunit YajC
MSLIYAEGGSGGSGFFLLIIIAFAFLWFVLIRPNKKRQNQQLAMLNNLEVGDEVVTAGGVYGEITRIDEAGDDLWVRIAPEVEVKVARRAIGGKIDRTEENDEYEPVTAPEPPTAE